MRKRPEPLKEVGGAIVYPCPEIPGRISKLGICPLPGRPKGYLFFFARVWAKKVDEDHGRSAALVASKDTTMNKNHSMVIFPKFCGISVGGPKVTE